MTFEALAPAKTDRLRYEHKYLVPERLLEPLRRCVAPFVRLDAHVPRTEHSYTVRNIYFDDATFRNYFEKDDGLETRAKPRIRAYDGYRTDALVFLEVKRRHGAAGSKDRAAIRYDDLASLLSTGDVDRFITPPSWMPDSRNAARKFLFQIHRNALRPVLFECYEREPYVGIIEPSLRVTFDQRIRSSMYPGIDELFTSDGKRQSFQQSFILEVKHDTTFGFPGWLKRFVSEHGIIRAALSKYWTCMSDWGDVHSHSRPRVHARQQWMPATMFKDQTTYA